MSDLELSTVELDGQTYEMWDSTKLKAYACQERGRLGHEEHLIPVEPAEALAFGAMFHKSIETWTAEVAFNNVPEQQAVELAVERAVKVWEKELPLETREMLELGGNRRSIANFKRLFEGFRRKFPLAMYESIIEVEKPFALALGETRRGVKVAWCGKRDRVLRWQGGVYYTDIKTSTYALDEDFFDKFKRSGQMLGYAWSGRQQLGLDFTGILIQGIQVQAPLKTKVRMPEELCQADTIRISNSQIDEWAVNTLSKIDRIHQAREEGYYNRDDGDLCQNFNRHCDFFNICTAEPEARAALKARMFKKRVWNPLDES
jgi:hypothetical protein